MQPEKNLLDHLAVIVRWRRLILTCVCAVTLITAGISFFLPKAYRARAIVYPPQENQGSLGGLSALIGNLPFGLLGLGEGPVSATDFVPILQSERVADAIIRRFDLNTRYEPETREQLLAMVSDRLEVVLSREQFLSVSYEAKTPGLAAEMTNAFVEELDRAIQERKTEQARSLREYLARRLHEAEREMNRAEIAYNGFQQKHMAIDLEAQAKAQIESAAKMVNLLAELIVKKDVADRMMTPGHPQLKNLEIEIAGAQNALDRILMGQSPAGKTGRQTNGGLPEIFIPFREVPAIGLEALQLKRDVEIQNAIYQFVLQEYEKARFEEEKRTPTVVFLDRAMPPDTRSRPRRTLMVLMAGGLSLLLSLLLAFLFEAFQNMDPENRAKLEAIRNDLRPR